MPIKGMRDIKTSTGAKNNTKNSLPLFGGMIINISSASSRVMGGQTNFGQKPELPDWDVKQHEFKKSKPVAIRAKSVFGDDLYLDEKLKRHLTQIIQETLQEIEEAMAEGIPADKEELNRLRTKLAGLTT